MRRGDTELSSATRLVVSDKQVYTQLSGEVVILDMSSGLYFGLNTVGAHIWSALQEPATVEDVVAHVVERYEVDEARAREDVMRLLNELLAARLVRRVSRDAGS